MAKRDGTSSSTNSKINAPGMTQKSVGIPIYDMDYFSGSQATIYIGDVFIDEITHFEVQVNQSKRPVYGYASTLFDAVSAGNVLVQGAFSINFKESGYLWLVLQRYKSLENAGNKVLDRYTSSKNKNTVSESLEFTLAGAPNNPFAQVFSGAKNEEGLLLSRANIQRLISGEATKSERFAFVNDFAAYATVGNPAAKDRAFEDIVEVFEDEVWKETKTDLDQMTRRTDESFFNDFDIFLVYGDVTNLGSNHTIKRIRNVHLTGSSQSLDINGEPIQEQYTFFARNLI